MTYIDKRYQIGNNAQDWVKKVVKVKEITYRGILAEYAEGVEVEVPWQDVKPLDITIENINQIGFSAIRTKANPYHKEIVAASIVNGRHYHMTGIIYEDKSLWSFNGISLRYFHQLQNILTILEPTIDPQVQCSPL